MTDTHSSSLTTLAFSQMSDQEVETVLIDHAITLSVSEARTISAKLSRDPTLVEAIIFGIQGSEHCSYKSSKTFLQHFPKESSHVILGPIEDSGIIAITDGPTGKRWGIAIAHESHNHPSQIVPFEGSATGIGGVVRDVLCMGARVIGCMDMLRLGDLSTEESRTIAKEVVRGIGGYGNPLGIPNLGGDTYFDSSFQGNCLVNAVAIGLVREDEVIRSRCPSHAGTEPFDIILVGKPTDRSGFGGASFASVTLEEEHKEELSAAVQEPNPFLERHLMAASYDLFDMLRTEGRLNDVSFKDLGAGGVVCASVEQVAAAGKGAEIDLERVPVALMDLPPEVIACAETQERLLWICAEDLTDVILDHYNKTWDLPSIAENAKAAKIGTVSTNPVYRLRYKGNCVCEVTSDVLTCAFDCKRETKKVVPSLPSPDIHCEGSVISVHNETYTFSDVFHALLSHPNAASKHPVTVHYDKNVQGQTIIEPGEASAGVIAPLRNLEHFVHGEHRAQWDDLPDEDRSIGVAFAAAGPIRMGRLNPYLQGLYAAIRAVCKVVSVGARPRALTDCLNYGNPEIPEHLWALEQGVKGISDAARGITSNQEPIPIISGNVSLYNTVPDSLEMCGERSIDPTAIVTCVGVMKDYNDALTPRLKNSGSTLLVLGIRGTNCGGSLYHSVLSEMCSKTKDSFLGGEVPHPDLPHIQSMIDMLLSTDVYPHLLSCSAIGAGGLLHALFEMTLPVRKTGGKIGVKIDLTAFPQDFPSDSMLFCESPGFIIEVQTEHAQHILTSAQALSISTNVIGITTQESHVLVMRDSTLLVDEPLSQLHALYTKGLSDVLKQ